MKYDACIDCGIEKTRQQRKTARCKSCACRSAAKAAHAAGNPGHKGKTHSLETRKQISACNKGRTCTLEHRRKISLAQGGDGNIENRRYPGLGSWSQIVKERDGWQCQLCGYQGKKGNKDVDAHHIIPKSKAPSLCSMTSNGITLCKTCHLNEHKQHTQTIAGITKRLDAVEDKVEIIHKKIVSQN